MITMILDNDIENIKVYDKSGVDRIFIDLEIHGKQKRQGHIDTVISAHSQHDIKKIKPLLENSELLVRINPLYGGSKNEIESSIENGADIIMLPMFKTVKEVQLFIDYVGKKTKTCLLLETSESLARVDDILEVDGIDEIHIGLNDLHLSMGLDFMFELMAGGIVEYISDKIKAKGIFFGIGGVARMGIGILPAEMIITEHVRLGSSRVILSRQFAKGLEINKNVFEKEVKKLQNCESEAKTLSENDLILNKLFLRKVVQDIVKDIEKSRS